MKVLDLDESNIYATNGLGIIVGEKGKSAIANEIFKVLTENAP